MADLSDALQIVTQAIAAYAGRARAETLLLIVAADPVSVRRRLAAIDAELGPQSPGIEDLSALIDEAERAVSR